MSVQLPLQETAPAPLHVQRPLTQFSPALHWLPHPPQLLGSVCKSAQVPLQRRAGAEHVHWPFWHTRPGDPQLAFVVHWTQRFVAVSQ